LVGFSLCMLASLPAFIRSRGHHCGAPPPLHATCATGVPIAIATTTVDVDNDHARAPHGLLSCLDPVLSCTEESQGVVGHTLRTYTYGCRLIRFMRRYLTGRPAERSANRFGSLPTIDQHHGTPLVRTSTYMLHFLPTLATCIAMHGLLPPPIHITLR
jgi:hypothetical protein